MKLKDYAQQLEDLLREIVESEAVSIYPSAIESCGPSYPEFDLWEARVNGLLERKYEVEP